MPELATKQTCTGCAACIQVCTKECLSMKRDEYGFDYPFFSHESSCINCHRCEIACPIVKSKLPKLNTTKAYSAFSTYEDIRLSSSSGGVFSLIASNVISHGGIVYGAAYTNNYSIEHIECKTEKDISKLRGAKYGQSNIASCYLTIKENLEKGIDVLFSGTPCQVVGLCSFLGKKYNNLITIDFICHGVPSPTAWTSYVQYRADYDNGGRLPEKINLRSKCTGWSNYSYSTLFQYENHAYTVLNSQDIFMKLFVGDYILRESCSCCKHKGYDRVSDFTLADFWGIWNIDSSMDDNKGTSLILTHSDKATELLLELKDKIIIKQVSLDDASQYNPSMLTSIVHKPERNLVLSLAVNGKYDEIEDMNLFKIIVSPKKDSIIMRGIKKIQRLVHSSDG